MIKLHQLNYKRCFMENVINNIIIDDNRRVGEESSKTFKDKLHSGFFKKYMSGKGLDIGFSGYISGVVPILPDAIGIDKTTPGYDGLTLPYATEELDYVYSSHTLEHITDYKATIKEWFRVIKEGGCLVITVPHRDLYERKLALPSKWNSDHRRFYQASTLLKEIEESLEVNNYRIREFKEDDSGYDYTIPLDKHPHGTLELLIVVQKIKQPIWKVE
jgi:SAM-dependent methyltransferase